MSRLGDATARADLINALKLVIVLKINEVLQVLRNRCLYFVSFVFKTETCSLSGTTKRLIIDEAK